MIEPSPSLVALHLVAEVANEAARFWAKVFGLWWVSGVLLAITYFAINYRSLPRRLSVTDSEVH